MSSSPHQNSQTLGLTLSTFWAGATFSLSTFLVPSLLSSPVPIMLTSFARMYNLGKYMAPPFSLLAAGAYGYAAYALPILPLGSANGNGSGRDASMFWRLVAAAVVSASLAPYTILFMGETNGELLRRERVGGVGRLSVKKGKGKEEKKDGEDEDGDVDVGVEGIDGKSSRELVDRWGVLNLIRAGILVVSTGLAASTEWF